MQSSRQHHMQLSEWFGLPPVCEPCTAFEQDSCGPWFGNIDTHNSYVGVNDGLYASQYSPTAGYPGFPTHAAPSSWKSHMDDITARNLDVPRMASVPDSVDLFTTTTSIPTTYDLVNPISRDGPDVIASLQYDMPEYGSSINICDDQSSDNNPFVPHAYCYTGRNTAHKKLACYMKTVNLKGHAFYQCSHPLCKTKPSSWTRKGIMVHLRRQHIPEFEKPFVCTKPGCGGAFLRESDAKRHVKTKNAGSTFACGFCCKKFERGDACKEHQTNCPRNFNFRTQL